MRDFIKRHILTQSFGQHLLSGLWIMAIIYISKDFVIFFLTAFLCGYLFQSISKWCRKILQKYSLHAPRYIKWILSWVGKEKVLITLFYIVFALILIFAIRDIGPALIADMINLLQSLSQKLSIDMGIDDIKQTLSQWQSLSYQVWDLLSIISPSTDTGTILQQFFHIGSILFQVIFAYILSYVWLLEQEKVQKYFAQMKKWSFSFFYHDLRIIFEKLTKSFGLVFHAQSKIALANTVLTVLWLVIIGIIYGQLSPEWNYIFPYLLALGCITFLTSFIPILWVFIGGIPIVFAGISAYPGWWIIVAIIVMLFVIHTIEGYFLNPRIVGKSLNIPAPIIFLILFVAEHFMGISGFFLGVPVYLLCMELFNSIAHFIQGQEV